MVLGCSSVRLPCIWECLDESAGGDRTVASFVGPKPADHLV